MRKRTKSGNEYDLFASNPEPKALEQIEDFADKFPDAHVAAMPDLHAGIPAPVGLTVNFCGHEDKYRRDIVGLVGNDIGCGVKSTIVRIPGGLTEQSLEIIYREMEESIKIFRDESFGLEDGGRNNSRTFGTLGNGNHFIEIGVINPEDWIYMITVHSGSRGLGASVYKEYSNTIKHMDTEYLKNRSELIGNLKALGMEKDIQDILGKISTDSTSSARMSPSAFSLYLRDMTQAMRFASNSRNSMFIKTVLAIQFATGVKVEILKTIENEHNYFDKETGIVRKGAIDSKNGFILTPLSMKEGVMVSIGFPSPENNSSAMHGAGRLFSRTKAREKLSLTEFKKEMEGIVSHPRQDTLDEAPGAYKPEGVIKADMGGIAMPLFIARPVLNFKGSDGRLD